MRGPDGTLAPVAAPDGQGSGSGFGANSWLVEEMYEQFVADPASVSESWKEFFADYQSQAPSVAAAAATSTQVQAVVEAYREPSDTEIPAGAAANGGASTLATPAAVTPAAATTPLDANSVLKILSLSTGNLLTWSSVSGKTYQVHATADLLTNFAPLSGIVTGVAPTATYLDTAATNSAKFYRVKIWP